MGCRFHGQCPMGICETAVSSPFRHKIIWIYWKWDCLLKPSFIIPVSQGAASPRGLPPAFHPRGLHQFFATQKCRSGRERRKTNL